LILQNYIEALKNLDYASDGHLHRMQQLVVAFGRSVGLDNTSISRLTLLAEFHDIGKVGVGPQIVFKPDKLTAEEITQMRRHCEIGHRIALISPELLPISDLILKHHEWWDGRGYPLGLRGEDIPIECRIMAIVDAYDVMTSHRPYKKSLRHAEALTELKSFSDSQFDPYLLDLFIDFLYTSFPNIP
jgi:HD-GYP domain-containing protein (c-di-GMP phosphodiesterase class II)